MKSIILAALFFSVSAFADEGCREESLVHFYAAGEEVGSELIGASDPCDAFGGNLVYTPFEKIFLYVNFNIAGSINLDNIDRALKASTVDEETRAWLRSVKLVLVDRGWIKRVYQDPREAVLNFGGDTLFVSEALLERGEFEALVADFYSGARVE